MSVMSNTMNVHVYLGSSSIALNQLITAAVFSQVPADIVAHGADDAVEYVFAYDAHLGLRWVDQPAWQALGKAILASFKVTNACVSRGIPCSLLAGGRRQLLLLQR